MLVTVLLVSVRLSASRRLMPKAPARSTLTPVIWTVWPPSLIARMPSCPLPPIAVWPLMTRCCAAAGETPRAEALGNESGATRGTRGARLLGPPGGPAGGGDGAVVHRDPPPGARSRVLGGEGEAPFSPRLPVDEGAEGTVAGADSLPFE